MLQTLRGLISEKLKGNIGTIALCSTLKGRWQYVWEVLRNIVLSLYITNHVIIIVCVWILKRNEKCNVEGCPGNSYFWEIYDKK
jgi:hypothetical protein